MAQVPMGSGSKERASLDLWLSEDLGILLHPSIVKSWLMIDQRRLIGPLLAQLEIRDPSSLYSEVFFMSSDGSWLVGCFNGHNFKMQLKRNKSQQSRKHMLPSDTHSRMRWSSSCVLSHFCFLVRQTYGLGGSCFPTQIARGSNVGQQSHQQLEELEGANAAWQHFPLYASLNHCHWGASSILLPTDLWNNLKDLKVPRCHMGSEQHPMES